MYTVGQLGKRFQLSRSTLLYYDSIGLLSPSARNAANYRLYSEADVQRMERIRVYRDAGLALETIADLLQTEAAAAPAVLERHLQQVNREIARLRQQQRIIVKLLGDASKLRSSRAIDKAQWTALLVSTGLSDEDMWRWHVEFEKMSPEGHQDFLESLGIGEAEIVEIWRRSAGIRERVF